MFGFLLSQAARARQDARNWIEVADKVINYRRDQLGEGDLRELTQLRDDLKAAVKAKRDAANLKLKIGAIEPVLHRCGGRIYPLSSTADNVQFFLAAAIVILGIKAFFLQPFKIPTNSMWPTYFGMKSEIWTNPDDAPGIAGQIVRTALFGAERKEFIAEASGEVIIPFLQVVHPESGLTMIQLNVSGLVNGRKWFVLPAQLKEYGILVGNSPSSVQVPVDFNFETEIADQFLGRGPDYAEAIRKLEREGRIVQLSRGWKGIKTGKQAKRGEAALSFDIESGDQLFVDRVSNHFLPPKVGEGFVFRTGNIHHQDMRGGDQYYVKRLAGLPGDRLEVREPVLLRNGAPITGGVGFELNGKQSGLYRGYQAIRNLAPGHVWEVPPDSFVALGDNSFNSADSRYWGFVPAEDAVGRPLFIYYPFTKRWGPTH